MDWQTNKENIYFFISKVLVYELFTPINFLIVYFVVYMKWAYMMVLLKFFIIFFFCINFFELVIEFNLCFLIFYAFWIVLFMMLSFIYDDKKGQNWIKWITWLKWQLNKWCTEWKIFFSYSLCLEEYYGKQIFWCTGYDCLMGLIWVRFLMKSYLSHSSLLSKKGIFMYLYRDRRL